MSCTVEKDCKQAEDTLSRSFDLSWRCARKWRPGAYVPMGSAIRVLPLEAGGAGTVGWEYECTQAGWTAQDEPVWPMTPGGMVADGSVEWQRVSVTTASLERSIANPSDAVWSADTPLVVSGATIDTVGGQVVVSAKISGGTARTKRSTYCDVTFTDGSVERFQIDWRIV